MDKNIIKQKKVHPSIIFLLVVLFIYILIALFDLNFVIRALFETLHMFVKILPLLVLVFFIIFLINMFVSSGKLKKYLGSKSGIKGWIYTFIAGVLISGPPYVLFPLLGDLKKQGMKDSLIALFLYNRNVKIPFIPIMIYYFGFWFTIVVSFYLLLFSVINGLVVGVLTKKDGIF